ncbi:MAG: DUF6516 family protein [Oligoflexales bacterium]
MAADLLYHSKVHLVHTKTNAIAIAELTVWKVPKDKGFPEGVKYSLFLVDPQSANVIVGFDNHKPKSHHVHRGKLEKPYDFQGIDQLVEDFWQSVKEEGYLTT